MKVYTYKTSRELAEEFKDIDYTKRNSHLNHKDAAKGDLIQIVDFEDQTVCVVYVTNSKEVSGPLPYRTQSVVLLADCLEDCLFEVNIIDHYYLKVMRTWNQVEYLQEMYPINISPMLNLTKDYEQGTITCTDSYGKSLVLREGEIPQSKDLMELLSSIIEEEDFPF